MRPNSEIIGKFRNRIPTVKLKIPGKAFLKSETRTSVTFKLQFLTLAKKRCFSQFFHGSGLDKSKLLLLVESSGQKL